VILLPRELWGHIPSLALFSVQVNLQHSQPLTLQKHVSRTARQTVTHMRAPRIRLSVVSGLFHIYSYPGDWNPTQMHKVLTNETADCGVIILAPGTSQADSECDMHCSNPNNSNEACGGTNRLTVYFSGTAFLVPVVASLMPQNWRYKGCYSSVFHLERKMVMC
jgi:hypothetical protein